MTASDGILDKPRGAKAIYVFAHGAGAGMNHPFMSDMAELLALHGIGSYRYDFPYMEAGRRRPDSPRIAQERVREAVDYARYKAPRVPLIAGGKSFGGRMTSSAQAAQAMPAVRGLLFLGFPLHAPGREGIERAAHLQDVEVPMLFVQGTRDTLARSDLMKEVIAGLGNRATLHEIEDGDHSFKVRKTLGYDPALVMGNIASAVADWTEGIL